MPRLRRALFDTDLPPYALFRRLRARFPHAFLLESAPGPRRLARYSMVGADPIEFLEDRDGADPLPKLREVRDQYALDERPGGFACGLVGAIAYDAVAHLDLPGHAIQGPLYRMGMHLDAIVYDHRQHRVEYVSAGEDRFEAFREAADRDSGLGAPLQVEGVKSNVDQDAFEGMVHDTKRRIRDGETYQTVLSRRFDARWRGDLGHLYRRLEQQNPSPYMYYLDLGDVDVIGSSPEMLLRVEDGQAETFPIAGTRPVVEDAAKDAAMRRELLEDPKENAEHLMLVDLARNDLARVCRFGSIDVPTYRSLESYARVHHLVSRVTGRLRDDQDALDAFAHVFPAGTVSGAPKIRAMQIIDQLERDPRNLYAGAVGYFGLDGSLDAAITIRTAVADRQGHLSVQAGAGIVADSDPTREWEETQHKADSILHFLEARA